MKRSITLVLCMVMLFSLLSGCGGSGDGGSGDVQSISWWLSKGEDSSYYLSYEENPVVKYLVAQEYNGKKVDLNFVVPIVGKELDNFNTLLMTDEYCDIMDMAYSTSYPAELYEDGYIWDLTPYIDQYMPNYKAAIEANPDLYPLIYSVVGGEKKILSICSITSEPSRSFRGFMYRRDWIVKYGASPQTGAAFTCGYEDPTNDNTYYDDVVFPSGGTDPVYISDWEWMFEIFSRALSEQGITDGYCYAPIYKGYNEDGSLFNAFGGGGPMWYQDKAGASAFGGDGESMRTYLQCMNTWYEKGWLDKNFAEHTSDAFYAIDTARVHMGKVGMWIGRPAELGNGIDVDDAYTDGAMVVGCRFPINDIYGDAACQNQEPYTWYQASKLRGSCVITNKVTEEELPTVLTFLDYLYTREGGAMLALGLTKEQADTIQDDFYASRGLVNGAHTEEQLPDGTWKYSFTDEVRNNDDLGNAVTGKRLYAGYSFPGVKLGASNPANVISNKAFGEWDFYLNIGFPDRALRSQFDMDESDLYGKVHANIDTYMSTTVPKFITGDLDIDSDSDWNDYCKMLNKYSPDKVTKIYQRVFDELS